MSSRPTKWRWDVQMIEEVTSERSMASTSNIPSPTSSSPTSSSPTSEDWFTTHMTSHTIGDAYSLVYEWTHKDQRYRSARGWSDTYRPCVMLAGFETYPILKRWIQGRSIKSPDTVELASRLTSTVGLDDLSYESRLPLQHLIERDALDYAFSIPMSWSSHWADGSWKVWTDLEEEFMTDLGGMFPADNVGRYTFEFIERWGIRRALATRPIEEVNRIYGPAMGMERPLSTEHLILRRRIALATPVDEWITAPFLDVLRTIGRPFIARRTQGGVTTGVFIGRMRKLFTHLPPHITVTPGTELYSTESVEEMTGLDRQRNPSLSIGRRFTLTLAALDRPIDQTDQVILDRLDREEVYRMGDSLLPDASPLQTRLIYFDGHDLFEVTWTTPLLQS